MKRLIFILSITLLTILVSCSKGMDKSFIEPMTVNELKANMKDSTFTDFYSNAQRLSKWVIASDMRQAQYGDISYKRLKKYITHRRDTVFFNKKKKIWKDEYNLLYPDYSRQVDSIMKYWQDYKDRYNMDSVVTIEFHDLWKEYYSYSGDIKDVNIGFKITPLKETIDQLVFRYEMKTKVSNDGGIGYLNGHRCVAASPISSPKTLYWEADYTDEKTLKNYSSSEVKRDFDFNIELVNVRINGENYEEKLNEIPEPVHNAIKYCSSDNNWYKEDIIKLLLNPNHKSIYDFSNPLIEAEMKKYDPKVHSLFDAYSSDDDNY